jgi:beta-hydroxylase
VSAFAVTRVAMFSAFVASALYVHYRGRVRLSFRRQLTDHSTFLAPYNVLVYLFSRVSTAPILDVADFPAVAPLREHWQEIRAEAMRLFEAGHIRASEKRDDLGFNSFFRKGWKRFYLKWYGEPLPSAKTLCPRTVELVESIPSVHGAMFALIGPQSKVGEHRDPFAGSLRYHLGLITPNRDECRIFIDDQPYSWRDGQDLVFDETYVHRFENLTDETRIILFCDVERPLRTPVMRAVNRFAIRYIVGMTASINVDGEELGLANRVFAHIYEWRTPFRRFKKRNRNAYYAIKYALILLVVWLAVFGGYRALR